jgi:hypothetical protein
MGLFVGLLTLPLAPVRGVVWLGEKLEAEASRQWRDPAAIRQQLAEVDAAYRRGELSEEQRDELEDALVARLLPDRGGGG